MTPYWQQGSLSIYNGDVRAVLAELPDESVHCCTTSPPYWALRDYGVEGQLGSEPTPEAYIETMVGVFRDVRRVMRKDSCAWINMGDSYNAQQGKGYPGYGGRNVAADAGCVGQSGLPAKNLLGIPWRLALALQADGWYLRADIIWHKPNPMPESVTDRPTKSHEYVFLLTKAANYFYDAEAVREKIGEPTRRQKTFRGGCYTENATYDNSVDYTGHEPYSDGVPSLSGRNLRDVWTIPTFSFPAAHFATYPPKLIEPCIRAGTSLKGCCAECGAPRARIVETDRKPTRPGRDNVSDETGMANRDEQRHVTEYKTTGWRDTCNCNALSVPCTVLDPFMGSGTTLLVARQEGCKGIGIELSQDYCKMAKNRLAQAYLDFVGAGPVDAPAPGAESCT